MENVQLKNVTPSAPMLPTENSEKEIVIIRSPNGLGKVLLREDTILANLHGCGGCGRGHFTCSGVKNHFSVLCWGKQSEKNYYILILLLSVTFVLSLIGSAFFCFTNTINDAILSNMVIREDSIAYSIWKRPNVQPLMKVYLFNYTNWEYVKQHRDAKLHVEEVGPYVYSQQLERVNIRFLGDRLTFQERNQFTYLANKTKGAHFDQVIVPNLPLIVSNVAHTKLRGYINIVKNKVFDYGMKKRVKCQPDSLSEGSVSPGVVAKIISMQWDFFSQSALNHVIKLANHPTAFIKLPVHRFLWGYDDTIINYAKPLLSLQGQLKFDNFGLLVTKNGTVSERFTINTGFVDKDKMNIIERVDGKDHLSIWGTPECNSIEGSDGTIFPPSLLDKNTTLHVYYPNLCRRLPFVYEKDIEIADGIQLLRYRMPLDVFDDPEHNPHNQCYCEIDTATCPPRGVINVTECAMGSPLLVSFPHFYLGDPKLRENITGMKPDPLKHDSYIDLHPTLGIALSGKSSLQINIQVKKNSYYSALQFLPDGLILPVAWIEMGVEDLPPSLRSLVYHGTYSTAAVQLGLTVICILACLVSGTCLVFIFVRRKKRPCATLKVKLPQQMELISKNQTS